MNMCVDCLVLDFLCGTAIIANDNNVAMVVPFVVAWHIRVFAFQLDGKAKRLKIIQHAVKTHGGDLLFPPSIHHFQEVVGAHRLSSLYQRFDDFFAQRRETFPFEAGLRFRMLDYMRKIFRTAAAGMAMGGLFHAWNCRAIPRMYPDRWNHSLNGDKSFGIVTQPGVIVSASSCDVMGDLMFDRFFRQGAGFIGKPCEGVIGHAERSEFYCA